MASSVVTSAMMKETSPSPKSPAAATAAPASDPRASERDSLLLRLLDSVKQCQIRFGKKQTVTSSSTPTSEAGAPVASTTTTLATEAEAQVICLLTNLEAALSHGLKQTTSSSALSLGGIFSSSSASEQSRNPNGGGGGGANRPTFWPFVRTFLGADDLARFDGGGGTVTTDLGRGRAWIRTALNENTLERYFYSLVNDVERIKSFYESWSFLRDEEKSSILPSMAAGLKTILFNVAADGADLDHAPPKSASSLPAAAERTILNSIPLGGIIRDSIISSSLPNSYNNSHNASGISGGEATDNYLEPVIVAPVPKRDDSAKSERASSSASNCESAPSSTSSATKKKKKKTVAHIVNFEENCGRRKQSPVVISNKSTTPPRDRSTATTITAPTMTTSTTTTTTMTATTTTLATSHSPATGKGTTSTPSPTLPHRQRTSEPPSALTLPALTPFDAVQSDGVAKERRNSSSTTATTAASEMRFVCGGGSGGGVMSPMTPTTPTIPIIAKEALVAEANNHDYDSSDAVSIKSAGQGSVASSTTSELSTSAAFPNGNGFFASATTLSPPSSAAPQYQPQPNHAPPTLLSLRNERYGVEEEGRPSSTKSSVADSAVSSLSSFVDNTATSTMTASTAASHHDEHEDLEQLSSTELRGAIVSIIQSKDAIAAALDDSRRRSEEALREVERLRGEEAALRECNDRLEKKVKEAEANADAKSKFLQRENQLLKHQLKKYVGTVQSMQRQQSVAVDGGGGGEAVDAAIEKLTLNAAAAADDTAGAVNTDDADADQIRRSYEQKLIQVSEMHSELMEFNDQLVMQIKQKDRLLDELRSELEDLRGPLPLGYAAADNSDAMSVASEVDDIVSVSSHLPSSASSCSFRALVNVWIPSAFLQTTNKDTFHVYQVYVRIRDEEWNVYRRYAQFYELHKSKKKKFPDISTIPFPPKKALRNKDEQFVEERRVKLQQYLRQLLNYLTQCTGYELAHAHPITKERLLGALPFFSDRALTTSGSEGGRSSSVASRGRRCTAEEPTTPQYMGL